MSAGRTPFAACAAFDRRALLRGCASLGILGLAPARRALALGRRDEAPRTLVILQLSGGNDGLSTVIPYADDGYARARATTRRGKEDVLPLDDYRGLHPELVRLRSLWDDGRLAIVEGVGYPDPNRSHFRSMDVWHAADRRGRAVPEGWIGRLAAAAWGEEADPLHVVHVGGAVPYSLHSTRHPPTAFAAPETFRWVEGEEDAAAVLAQVEATPPANAALAHLRETIEEGRAASRAVRSAAARYRPAAPYPASDLGRTLETAAALVASDLGTRVVSVELTGFDTHNDQRQRHDQLMRTLDEALGAFLTDLGASEPGRRAVVLAFSEFGRRVQENGSRGTDHGCAGPAFVLGHGVRGGLHGAHPSLDELDAGDLVFTTDFRSVYAALIEGCFGVRATDVLAKVPGKRLRLLA